MLVSSKNYFHYYMSSKKTFVNISKLLGMFIFLNLKQLRHKFLLLFCFLVIFLVFNGFDKCSSQSMANANQSKSGSTYRLNNEKRLIADLFDNYQVKFGRPVNNMTEKVVVSFGIILIQLIDLDERNQVLITNVHSVYVSYFLFIF